MILKYLHLNEKIAYLNNQKFNHFLTLLTAKQGRIGGGGLWGSQPPRVTKGVQKKKKKGKGKKREKKKRKVREKETGKEEDKKRRKD